MNIAILAKAPFLGFAKTRLTPLLGEKGAMQAHKTLVDHTLSVCLQAQLGPCTLWVTDPHPFFVRYTRNSKIKIRTQPEGHLGKRMATAIRHADQPTLLVGTDCPVLTPQLLRECAARLQRKDLLTCPAEDGGFVLIGTSKPEKIPFNTLLNDIAWGTDQALSQLERNVAELCIDYTRGPTLWDVDEPEDHQRWLKIKQY